MDSIYCIFIKGIIINRIIIIKFLFFSFSITNLDFPNKKFKMEIHVYILIINFSVGKNKSDADTDILCENRYNHTGKNLIIKFVKSSRLSNNSLRHICQSIPYTILILLYFLFLNQTNLAAKIRAS